MLNRKGDNQHYVSQVLLRRFTIPGRPLQCHQIQSGKWKDRNTGNVFAARGWNQLLVSGNVDNTLEAEFSKVESLLPRTFKALEEAANETLTVFSRPIYENMCRYCAYLLLTSPFAKAKAVADFLLQVNFELEHGKDDLLRSLGFSQKAIERFREARARGDMLIIYSKDSWQLVYRIQFNQMFTFEIAQFLYWTKWEICHSPIEFPVSDIALVPLHDKEQNANYYILPIAPKLLLKGRIDIGPQTPSSHYHIKGTTLAADEAEYWLDIICASAVTELVSFHRMPDVPMRRSRAETNGISFTRIVNPELLVSAGSTDFNTDFGLQIVSQAEYVRFIHSFIQPATPPAEM